MTAIDQVDQFIRDGRWREAMEALERRAEAGAGAPGVPDLLEASYAAADGTLWDDAERLLRRVIDQAPECVDAYVKLGLVLKEVDRLDEACAMFEHALTIEMRQPVLTMLGWLQFRLKKDDAALATLRRSISLNPEDDEAHYALGLALRDPEPELAVEHFRRALAVDPQLPGVSRELGFALSRVGRRDEAFDAIRQAIRLDDSDAWAHTYLGLLLDVEGELEEAQRAFARAAELMPRMAYFWANLGRVTSALREYERAEACFRKGLMVGLDDPVLVCEYGALLMKTGRLSKARRYLKRSLRLWPGNRRAKGLLARIDRDASEGALPRSR